MHRAPGGGKGQGGQVDRDGDGRERRRRGRAPAPGSSARIRIAGASGRLSIVGASTRAGARLVAARANVRNNADGAAPSQRPVAVRRACRGLRPEQESGIDQDGPEPAPAVLDRPGLEGEPRRGDRQGEQDARRPVACRVPPPVTPPRGPVPRGPPRGCRGPSPPPGGALRGAPRPPHPVPAAGAARARPPARGPRSRAVLPRRRASRREPGRSTRPPTPAPASSAAAAASSGSTSTSRRRLRPSEIAVASRARIGTQARTAASPSSVCNHAARGQRATPARAIGGSTSSGAPGPLPGPTSGRAPARPPRSPPRLPPAPPRGGRLGSRARVDDLERQGPPQAQDQGAPGSIRVSVKTAPAARAALGRTPGQISCHQIRRSVAPASRAASSQAGSDRFRAAAVARATSGTPLASATQTQPIQPARGPRLPASRSPATRPSSRLSPRAPNSGGTTSGASVRAARTGRPQNRQRTTIRARPIPSTRETSVTAERHRHTVPGALPEKGIERRQRQGKKCRPDRPPRTAVEHRRRHKRQGRGKHGNPEARSGPSSYPSEEAHPHRFIPDPTTETKTAKRLRDYPNIAGRNSSSLLRSCDVFLGEPCGHTARRGRPKGRRRGTR